MFCEHCGKKIDDDSIFCPHCGSKLDYDVVGSGKESENKSNTEDSTENVVGLNDEIISNNEIIDFRDAEIVDENEEENESFELDGIIGELKTGLQESFNEIKNDSTEVFKEIKNDAIEMIGVQNIKRLKKKAKAIKDIIKEK